MSTVPRIEYWVVRVVLHQGRRSASQMDLFAGVDSAGRVQYAKPSDGFVMLPDNTIAEPVEVFDGVGAEEAAHRRREVLRTQHPAEDFRVILNGDMPDA